MFIVLIFALTAVFIIWICLTHHLKDRPELKEKLYHIVDTIIQKTMLLVWLSSIVTGVLITIKIFRLDYKEADAFFIWVVFVPCILAMYVLQSWLADYLWRSAQLDYSTNVKIIAFTPLVVSNFVQLYFAIVPTNGIIQLSTHVCVWVVLGLLNLRRMSYD